MNLMVAADKNWGIGFQGGLLVSIPADMQYFKKETMGKVVVMGRKTMESLPGGQPLAFRTNVVLSRDPAYKKKGATVVHSYEEAKAFLSQYPPDDVFIIGGEEVYRTFLQDCQTAYVTWLDYTYHADTWLPNLEESGEWELVEESEEQTYFNLEYTFRIYRRK